MTPMKQRLLYLIKEKALEKSEYEGWYRGEPDRRGRYLVIEACFWMDRMADWIPGDGKRPGRFYIDGMQPCEASGVAYFRPRPAIPIRPKPAMLEKPEVDIHEG